VSMDPLDKLQSAGQCLRILHGRSTLAAFLKAKEIRVKLALLDNDLRLARRLVNGGSHGLDGFTDAYRIGERLITA